MNQETLKRAKEIDSKIEDYKNLYERLSDKDCTSLYMRVGGSSIDAKRRFWPISPENFKLKYLQNISIEISRLENELASL